jgi:hypothetical protein
MIWLNVCSANPCGSLPAVPDRRTSGKSRPNKLLKETHKSESRIILLRTTKSFSVEIWIVSWNLANVKLRCDRIPNLRGCLIKGNYSNLTPRTFLLHLIQWFKATYVYVHHKSLNIKNLVMENNQCRDDITGKECRSSLTDQAVKNEYLRRGRKRTWY